MTVYYSQEDKRWANTPYTIRNDPKQTIGTSGCGPTCFAMIAASWVSPAIQPPETAKYAVARGYRTPNDGTAWAYYSSIAKHYGLSCVQTGSLDRVKQALADGALVITSMGPGDFTGGGHYILLVGIDGRMIDVYDPNHDNTKYGRLIDQGIRNDGKVRADESVFRAQARQYWIFPKPIKEDEPMTVSERREFEEMKTRVGELTSAVTVLTMQIAAAKEAIPAPKWFVSEFGDGVTKKIQGDGKSAITKPPVFWETLAVSLRMQGLGKGAGA